MFKKLMFLALMLLPATAMARFPDVYDTNPYLKGISYVEAEGIVEGYEDGLYRPNNAINRAEFLKILMLTTHDASEISECTASDFYDVLFDEWFTSYVCFAYQARIIDGYPDGSFKPDMPIKFVEAAKILHNTMLPDETVENDAFTEWYEPHVEVLSRHGAIPQSIRGFEHYISRGEMAEMIYRLDNDLVALTSLTMDEIVHRELIEKYYQSIGSEEAYNMKIDPGMTLAEYEELYEDFPYAVVSGFQKTGPATYDLRITTWPNLSKGPGSERSGRYKAEMQVVDGKLRTLSSEPVEYEVIEQISTPQAMATLEWDNGIFKVFLLPSGEGKFQVAEFDTLDALTYTIRNIAFSPTGRYITYELSEWEFGGLGLIDTELKQVQQPFAGLEMRGFTDDDAYFFVCSEAGMGSGDAVVLALPGFEQLLRADESIKACEPFDYETNTLRYRVFGPEGEDIEREFTIE